MKRRYISKNRTEYEVIGTATNIETGEGSLIYREVFGNRRVFVCSKAWWNSQGFISVDEYTEKGINKYSHDEDKIKLYMSLFAGRDDVYAKRYERKDGGSGYVPVCRNEWRPSVCIKPSGKCADCEFKDYESFDEGVVNRHLRGMITAGIYPLMKDETCRFLAVDFDGEMWHKDILAVYSLCRDKSIPTYMERSRSGDGGHLWIFFSEDIPASLARKLGSCILTAAMNERHEIKFSSYDRLFPNQDTMPKGGFGNLIALPLQKEPRKNSNSVFIDDGLHPYDDQWLFLNSVRKINEYEVNAFIKSLGGSDFGRLYEDNSDKPWEKKKPIKIASEDFPKKVNIVLSNMIYIEKSGISSKGLTVLKRLASFKNPDYYKTQAMRLSTYNKPRIISLAEDHDSYIALPRGLFDEVVDIFVNNDVIINISDRTNEGRRIDVKFSGTLREEQKRAKKALICKNCGVLSASTAFGKTVVGASLIAERKVNTLILVHRTNLLKQWIDRLKDFLIINEDPPLEYTPTGRKRKTSVIGQIGGTKNNPSGIIDVAVMQSLVNDGEVKDIVKQYGMVIVDECHHVSAFTFEQILKSTDARYVYGLTATPTRQDGHQPIIYMQCGNIAYAADNKKQSEEHPFEHYMIPRFTAFRCKSDKITDLYAAMAVDELRNELIIEDCVKTLEAGRTPIILTERTSHVDLLADKLGDYKVIKLVGGMGNKKNEEIANELKVVSDDEKLVIIATGRYVGEGFDYPRLDTLLLAMPISWKGTLQQYAGRLHRNYEGKNEVRVYDYIDINVPMLEKMYQKRLKGYNSIGYKVKSDEGLTQSISGIYDNTNFLDVFASDISSAQKSVIIVSPFVIKSSTNKMLPLLDGVIGKVTVITRPPENYKSDAGKRRAAECIAILKSCGTDLKLKDMFHQKFAVIDDRVVWYGSINFLSFGASEENVMRLKSSQVAAELMETVEI